MVHHHNLFVIDRCDARPTMLPPSCERVGRQHEIRDVRRVIALHRCMSFCVVRRNSCLAVSFWHCRTLPVRTCQLNPARIFLRKPLESPQCGLIVCGGRLQSSIRVSFTSIHSEHRSCRCFRDLQLLDVLVGLVYDGLLISPFAFF